jgi:acetyltransferase-like isoleucine patch superfamily enzyme
MKKIVERFLFRTGWKRNLYAKLCPSAKRWADYLRQHGGFESIGLDCEINRDASITDPYLVRIGNHVTLSSCSLIGHDGSIKQIYNATGRRVDAVGKIDIKDNCFIGYRAIILRNVTIGPNSIVAAGAIVTKDVPPNSIVAGGPAKVIGTIGRFAEKLNEETRTLPWVTHIEERDGPVDWRIEAKLREMRKIYFWGSSTNTD